MDDKDLLKAFTNAARDKTVAIEREYEDKIRRGGADGVSAFCFMAQYTLEHKGEQALYDFCERGLIMLPANAHPLLVTMLVLEAAEE